MRFATAGSNTYTVTTRMATLTSGAGRTADLQSREQARNGDDGGPNYHLRL